MRAALAFAVLILLSLSASGPAQASEWPDSIFDGASPAVLSVIKDHPDLVNDAENHIYICLIPSEKTLCQVNQFRFVLDYVAAFYNDHNSQKNLEDDFSEQAAGFPETVSYSAPMPGILPNPIQSCAWSEAILGSGGSGVEPEDTQEVDIYCRNLSPDASDAAKARATAIDTEIAAHVGHGPDPSSIIDGD